MQDKLMLGKNAHADMYREDNVLGCINVYSIILMFSVLKHFSDKEHPMSASDIATKIHDMINTDMLVDEKTVKTKKLSPFCEAMLYAKEDDSYKNMYNMIVKLIGGEIVRVSPTPDGKQKRHERFYFKPLLNPGDIEMINGSIISNQFLSDEAKQYIISRENTLSSSAVDYSEANITSAYPDFPKRPNEKKDGEEQKEVLSTINTLYEAIRNKWQVKIIYGAFEPEKNAPKVSLKRKNTEPYILNPYAMIWSDGHYYLIATHNNHSNTVYFRIDRIMDIRLNRNPENVMSFVERASIPKQLVPYFKKGMFQTEKFVHTYPLSAIHDDENICDCVLSCRLNALQIIIDTFGKDIKIRPDKDNDGLYQVSVRAQLENVCRFCNQQHAVISPVMPDELVESVKSDLKRSLENLS